MKLDRANNSNNVDIELQSWNLRKFYINLSLDFSLQATKSFSEPIASQFDLFLLWFLNDWKVTRIFYLG